MTELKTFTGYLATGHLLTALYAAYQGDVIGAAVLIALGLAVGCYAWGWRAVLFTPLRWLGRGLLFLGDVFSKLPPLFWLCFFSDL